MRGKMTPIRKRWLIAAMIAALLVCALLFHFTRDRSYTEVTIEIDKDLTSEIRANVMAAHKMVVDVESEGEKTMGTVALKGLDQSEAQD